MSDRDFTDDTVDAGAIGAGHEVTVLYAIRLRDGVGEGDRLAEVRLRWTDPERGSTEELGRDVALADLAPRLASTDPGFQLDLLVATTAEVLRGSEWTGDLDVHEIVRVVGDEAFELPRTDQAHDFLDLLDELARMEE